MDAREFPGYARVRENLIRGDYYALTRPSAPVALMPVDPDDAAVAFRLRCDGSAGIAPRKSRKATGASSPAT